MWKFLLCAGFAVLLKNYAASSCDCSIQLQLSLHLGECFGREHGVSFSIFVDVCAYVPVQMNLTLLAHFSICYFQSLLSDINT